MIAIKEMIKKITPDKALKLLFPSSNESDILFLATLNISVDLKNKNTAVRDNISINPITKFIKQIYIPGCKIPSIK
jgi:cell division protein ZapA (FtsZ GTPase activity inhibitor)